MLLCTILSPWYTVFSFHPLIELMRRARVTACLPVNRWENGSPEQSRNWPKVTRVLNVDVGIWLGGHIALHVPYKCLLVAWGFLLPTLVFLILFKSCLSLFDWVFTTLPITKKKKKERKKRIRGWVHICSVFLSPNNKNWRPSNLNILDPNRNYFLKHLTL